MPGGLWGPTRLGIHHPALGRHLNFKNPVCPVSWSMDCVIHHFITPSPPRDHLPSLPCLLVYGLCHSSLYHTKPIQRTLTQSALPTGLWTVSFITVSHQARPENTYPVCPAYWSMDCVIHHFITPSPSRKHSPSLPCLLVYGLCHSSLYHPKPVQKTLTQSVPPTSLWTTSNCGFG